MIIIFNASLDPVIKCYYNQYLSWPNGCQNNINAKVISISRTLVRFLNLPLFQGKSACFSTYEATEVKLLAIIEPTAAKQFKK